jgi:protease-4
MGFFHDPVQEDGERSLRPRYRKLWIFLLLAAGTFFVLLFIGLLFPPSDHSGISIIRVEGTLITGDTSDPDYTGSENVGEELRTAGNDPLIGAIVLRVNSPGGTPAAAQEIIRDLEYARKKKPVVISMGDVATSAAYWISTHGDKIYANPDTITAGIGTIWTFTDISQWLEREGYNVTVVKSGMLKDMASPYRAITEEERSYAQEMVNASFEDLVQDVLAQRNINRTVIEDGRVIRGRDALKLGIIDAFGNLNDAIAGARDLIQPEEPEAPPKVEITINLSTFTDFRNLQELFR